MINSNETERSEHDPEHFRKLVFRGWLIVCGIAVAFVLYGLFAFFVIGDRQPSDWDFGEIQDTPGESVYSTFPYRGRTEEPQIQHVDRKPPKASTTISDNPPPPPGSEEKGFENTGGRGSDQMTGPKNNKPTSSSK